MFERQQGGEPFDSGPGHSLMVLFSISSFHGVTELQLRSVVGERGKWSGGRRAAPSETQPKRNGPPPSRRRKPAALAAFRRMPARDERAGLRSGTGAVERVTGPTGSPWSGANRALVTATMPVARPISKPHTANCVTTLHSNLGSRYRSIPPVISTLIRFLAFFSSGMKTSRRS